MGSDQPKDYALVVGIDNYPNFGSNGRDLQGAINDAKAFADWLTNKNTGGGLEAENCKLVTSAGNPMNLNKDTIDDALDEIWKSAKADGGGRRLYMFFSGHGQLVDTPNMLAFEQTLCLPRWSFTRPNAAILTKSYQQAAQKCMPFEETAVFLDCCRVSSTRVRADSTSLGCKNAHGSAANRRRQIFYASEPMKKAFEDVLEGEEGDEGEIVHGYFTAALIEGLKRGSERVGGGISAHDLWQHLEYWVPKSAAKDGHTQRPMVEPDNPYADMVFGTASPSGETSNFEIRFSDWRSGMVKLLDADTEVVHEADAGAGSWQLDLSPQLYMLMDDDRGDNYSFHFRDEMRGSHVTF